MSPLKGGFSPDNNNGHVISLKVPAGAFDEKHVGEEVGFLGVGDKSQVTLVTSHKMELCSAFVFVACFLAFCLGVGKRQAIRSSLCFIFVLLFYLELVERNKAMVSQK